MAAARYLVSTAATPITLNRTPPFQSYDEFEDDGEASWTDDDSASGSEGGADAPGGGSEGVGLCSGGLGGGGGALRPQPARWVPYRHTNGVAIYRHPQEGEYMASSIVKVGVNPCSGVCAGRLAGVSAANVTASACGAHILNCWFCARSLKQLRGQTLIKPAGVP
jgi:hypothetical protein